MAKTLALLLVSVAVAIAPAGPALADEPSPPEEPQAATPTPVAAGELPPPAWGFDGPYRFEIGASVGYAHRADGSPVFANSNDAGISGGLQLRLFVSERVGFGLGYEHVGLWTESSGVLESGTFDLGRRLDTLLASVRLRPYYGEALGVFLDIGFGPSWQGVSLTGAAWSPVTPGIRVPVRCSGGGSVGFALRAAAGVEVPISEAFGTELGLGLDLYRHSDELVGNCAPGAGSVVSPGVRLAFLYGFGL